MNLEERLITQAIQIPASPFWEVFKRFGRDELIAGIISLSGTAFLEALIRTPELNSTQKLALAITGPIIEKIGFFVGHVKDAYSVYKTTPLDKRETLSFYIKKAFKGGSKSLLEDILVHDPLYIGLMLGGMSIHPATPAWVFVPIAFGAAVLVVAAGEVGFTELRYKWFQRSLFKKDFKSEHYLESRFYLNPEANSSEIIQQLRDQFLPAQEIKTLIYNDLYFKPKLPCFNARCPKIRLRERTHKDGFLRTAQIIYTRAVEQTQGNVDQFRFFPQHKDKFYYTLSSDVLPEDLQSIPKVGLTLSKLVKDSTPLKVKFTRHVAYDASKIFIAVDQVHNSPLRVVEIKVYPNKQSTLKEVMRFIMHRFPVLQTTYGKFDLII